MDIFVDGGFKNQAMYVAVTSLDGSINFAKQIASGGTSNAAEKNALLEGLKYLEAIGCKEIITVYTDMQSLPELLKRTDLKSKNIITSHIETYNIAVTDDKNVKTTPIMSPSTNIDNIESNIPIVVIDEGFSLNECSTIPSSAPILYLRPRTICAGIGCKRNMEQKPIEEALLQTLKEEGIHPLSLKCIATIPLKSDEPGIIGTAANLNVPLQIIPTEEIENLDISQLGIQTSEFVASQTGVLSVSTACSYLASGKGEILKDKAKYKGITNALSKENS